MAIKVKMALSGAAIMIGTAAQAAETIPALRVCADPGNMPLSNTAGEGFHNKIVEVIAAAMGTHVTYAYRPYLERGLTRQTFSNNRCDILMDMSPDNDRMITTTPLYRSTFVMATRADSEYQFKGFNDPELKQQTIGVFQHSAIRTELMEHGINGDNLRIHTISHNADLKPERQPTRQVQAVIDGKLDVAGAWGPLAGWYNSQGKQPLRLYPLNAIDTVLPMEFELAIGLKKQDKELRDAIDKVLWQEKGKIKQILLDYGVPLVECEICVVSGDLQSHGAYHQPQHVVAKYQPALQSDIKTLPAIIDKALQAGSSLEDELINAVLAKDWNRIEYLISRGANTNATDTNGLSPLMHAIKGGNLELVKLLLNKQADPNVADNDGWTAAMHAAWLNEPKILRVLGDYGADFERLEKLTGSTAMGLAVQKGKTLAVVAMLDSGANPDLAMGDGAYTPLMIAANQGEVQSAQVLLQYGARVNATNTGGVTALMIASANNHAELVSLLLKSGADPLLEDERGDTAYQLAQQRGATDALEMFHRLNVKTTSSSRPTVSAEES